MSVRTIAQQNKTSGGTSGPPGAWPHAAACLPGQCLMETSREGRREGTEHRTPFFSLPRIDSAPLRGLSLQRFGTGEGQV